LRRIKFRFTIEHLWGLIVLMGIFIFVNTHPIRPYDFWWHITIGGEIITTGRIPAADVYSFTEAGQPYPSYQMFWLMETFLYEVYQVGGPALVVFLQSLMITAAYVILFWVCKLSTGSWRMSALGVLFAAALGINDWNVRPQAITFLLASLILLAIYKYRQNPDWGWLVVFPLCMLVWVNSHGTFLIGLVLVGLWWGQELWQAIIRRLKHEILVGKNQMVVPGLMFGITALACLANPRGFGIINYLRTLTTNSVVQNLVTEWAPPAFSTWMGAIFLCGLMASAVLLALSPKRPDFFQITTFLVFGLLGLKTSRGIVWFGLLMAPILAVHLFAIVGNLQKAERKPVNQEGSRVVNLVFAILIILMGVISLPWFKSVLPLPTTKAGLISSETPVQATKVLLAKNLPGRVFNAMSFGSYLIWAAYPQYQVFVDSRIELFSEKVWLDYLNISNAEGNWEALLSDYGVNTLMLSPQEQSPLIKSIDSSQSWSCVYQDEAASIYTRIK
jgi:hypothetical protein